MGDSLDEASMLYIDEADECVTMMYDAFDHRVGCIESGTLVTPERELLVHFS